MRKSSFVLIVVLLVAGIVTCLMQQGQQTVSALAASDQEVDNEEVYSYIDVLEAYYQDYVVACENANVPVSKTQTFEQFCEAFYAQDELTITEFAEYSVQFAMRSDDQFVPMAPMSAGVIPGWYNDVGTGALPQKPSYGKFSFDLLPGDIYYQEEGFPIIGIFSEKVVGHIGIVEGRFYEIMVIFGELLKLVQDHQICCHPMSIVALLKIIDLLWQKDIFCACRRQLQLKGKAQSILLLHN